MRKILMYVIILGLFWVISPKVTDAAVQCPSNLTPALQLADPSCWTSAYILSGKKVSCTWSVTGSEKICVPCSKSFGCDWSKQWTTTGSCGSDHHYADNVFLIDNCGHSTSYCNNLSMPSNPYTYWLDTSHWDNNCYYTTPTTWGVPDPTGMRMALTVNQLVALGTTSCSNISNIDYANAIPDLKINGSDGFVTADKFGGINITWGSVYATSCNVPATNTGVNWFGSKSLSGTQPNTDISSAPKPISAVAPATILNYKISCTNPGGVDVLDNVGVRVTCTPDLNPAWGACDKQCGTGDQTRTIRYGNCYEVTQHNACNKEACPVTSEWREVKP